MEHEREPLRWRERVEHNQEGEADRVGEYGFVLGLRHGIGADQGIGNVAVECLLPSHVPSSQHVQAYPGNNRREPAAEVLDLARVGPADAQPSVLDGIVGFTQEPSIRYATDRKWGRCSSKRSTSHSLDVS